VQRALRRRRLFRGRAGVALAVVLSTVAATGAFAQDAATPQASGTRAVQQKLGVSADGVYGPRTRSAVKRFQRTHGLAVDGIAGPATLAALGVASQAPASAAAPAPESSTLQRIAQCESSGNPSAVSADGTYRGKYQFDSETWQAMGGSGDPAAAPEAEQDRIAAKLLAARGAAPWPNCA
jgi:peptidoglycan hydrolase-like protein with peptidoglycan-binding domain